jgi:undecaprenyl-diphosphatase
LFQLRQREIQFSLYIMNYFEVFILSLIEGLTEFIPVSSTGHLILAGHFLNLQPTEFLKAFDVIIQFGAILAVIYLYKDKFLKADINFYKKLFVGFLPAAVVGFLIKDVVANLSENNLVIALSLIIGGIILLFVDSIFKTTVEKNMSMLDSFKIGFLQCVAMIPGVSRSGATIVGAQALGFTKKTAAEFSFFLAVPTMAAATLYKLWKIRHIIQSNQIIHLTAGIVLSFIFAVLAIKFFISLIQKYGFRWFGVYRIIIGVIVLVYFKN